MLLPKPYEAAERRALSGCDPNIDRVVMFGLRFVPMVVRRGPCAHNWWEFSGGVITAAGGRREWL